MNSRRTLYSYITLMAALVVSLLFARSTSGMNGAAPDPNAAESAAEYSRLATYSFADPFFFEDTTDRAMLPAEKAYKNITTMKGMTAGELLSAMTFMSNALGVRCGFCHAQGDFASDDKPEKKTARAMITMTNDINEKNFGALTVTCNTCHQGKPHPVAVPSLAQGDWSRLDLAWPAWLKRDSSTTVDAVLDRYAAALGGTGALGKVTTRVVKVTEAGAGGTPTTAEIFQKAPNMFRSTTVSSDPKRGTGIDTYDGRTGWMMFGNRPVSRAGEMELEQLIRMAEFFPAVDLRRDYSKVQLIGKERVGERDLYIVAATRNDKTTDRLYFDAATGLLARRYVQFSTPFGAIPFSIEYSDYHDVDGVRYPYTMKWSTPRESWTETIAQLRHNVTIADTMFAKPR